MKNAARLRRVVGVPVVDDERLALYHLWHAQREEARGWEPSDLDPERYAVDFAFPHPRRARSRSAIPTTGIASSGSASSTRRRAR